MKRQSNIVGLIPACGEATRFPGLPVSKEIFPITHDEFESSKGPHLSVISSYLLQKLKMGGAHYAYFIIRKGKWDIPNYYLEGSLVNLKLAYIVSGGTPSVPNTIEEAYSFIKNDLVLFGYPDILIRPDDIYNQLVYRLNSIEADVVIGLFDLFPGQLTDRVDIDKNGYVHSIDVRSTSPDSKPGWSIAAWKPAFTSFLHHYINPQNYEETDQYQAKESFLGNVFEAALGEGIKINSVYFSGEHFWDIGTPKGLNKALQDKSQWK
jgi:glucose-1-phosphate thymidylyltransferase